MHTFAQQTFLIFYPAVLVAALVGGARAGWTAVTLSAFVVWWVWSPGMHHIPADRPEAINNGFIRRSF